ncbi:MAG: hypothetical protein ACI8QF_003264 [Limisphaerales bacterium]
MRQCLLPAKKGQRTAAVHDALARSGIEEIP